MSDAGIDIIPDDIVLSKDIQEHLNVDLPLLDRQIRRLRDAINERAYAKEMEKFSAEADQSTMEVYKQISATEHEIGNSELSFLKEKMNVMNSTLWQETLGSTDLNENLQLGVISYLTNAQEDEVLASDITESLVKYYEADKDVYSTGKYKIYPFVCMFLEYLVDLNKLELIKTNGQRDRAYKLKKRVE